jgi:hypothetical protein
MLGLLATPEIGGTPGMDSFRKEPSPLGLILASGPEKCERIHSSCYSLPGLWYFLWEP